jgi:hypothetical protein
LGGGGLGIEKRWVTLYVFCQERGFVFVALFYHRYFFWHNPLNPTYKR